MRQAPFTALLCGVAAFALCAEPVTIDDSRDLAKREAWGFAVLVASVLEHGDNHAFPGIRAWLEDFRRIEAGMPAFNGGGRFPALDGDVLVSRNPRFWTACYEIVPGDPGWSLLHASLLLCGGEAQRAVVIATLGLQRGGAPPEFKRGLETIIAGAHAAQANSLILVSQGVILHDAGYFDGALHEYDAALAEWPANGRAHYERGSTLRMKAIADAARTRPVSHKADAEEVVSDPPGTRESFALARKHDPFCVMAYQGEDPTTLAGMMALVRTALPIWDSIRKRPAIPATREELRDLAESCRTAGIDEFALAARQQLVARNRHYQGDDPEFIVDCIQRLAPSVDVKATLARMATSEPVTAMVDAFMRGGSASSSAARRLLDALGKAAMPGLDGR